MCVPTPLGAHPPEAPTLGNIDQLALTKTSEMPRRRAYLRNLTVLHTLENLYEVLTRETTPGRLPARPVHPQAPPRGAHLETRSPRSAHLAALAPRIAQLAALAPRIAQLAAHSLRGAYLEVPEVGAPSSELSLTSTGGLPGMWNHLLPILRDHIGISTMGR